MPKEASRKAKRGHKKTPKISLTVFAESINKFFGETKLLGNSLLWELFAFSLHLRIVVTRFN